MSAPVGRWSITLDDHVETVAVDPTGRWAVAGSLAGDAVVLDVRTGEVVTSLPQHHMGVLDASWAPGGDRLATGGQDGVLRIHDTIGVTIGEHVLGEWVQNLTWSARSVLAGSAGRTPFVLDDTGLRPAVRQSSTVTDVAWSDNQTRLGVTAYGGVSWFDTDRPDLDQPTRRHEFAGSPLSLAISPTGRWACAGYQDASIHVWPLWSGDDLAMSGYPAKIEHVEFRHDGRWLASACLDEVTLWDFGGRGPKGSRPAVGREHGARITWVGWQPGGDLLATADQGGTVVFWQSPSSSRTLRARVVLHADREHAGVGAAAWHPDGRSVIVGRHDGTVEVVPAP